jgi:hypothetical protein
MGDAEDCWCCITPGCMLSLLVQLFQIIHECRMLRRKSRVLDDFEKHFLKLVYIFFHYRRKACIKFLFHLKNHVMKLKHPCASTGNLLPDLSGRNLFSSLAVICLSAASTDALLGNILQFTNIARASYSLLTYFSLPHRVAQVLFYISPRSLLKIF